MTRRSNPASRKTLNGASGSTFLNYERDTRLHLVPAFGGILLTRFEALQAQHFVDQLMSKKVLLPDGSGRRDPKRHYSLSRLKQITIPLTLMLDFAVTHKLVGRNVLRERPVQFAAMPEAELEIIDFDEARKILIAVEQRTGDGTKRGGDDIACTFRNRRLLFPLLMFTGMREGEACGLQWAKVDLEKRFIHVRHQMQREGNTISDRLKSKNAGARSRSTRRSIRPYFGTHRIPQTGSAP